MKEFGTIWQTGSFIDKVEDIVVMSSHLKENLSLNWEIGQLANQKKSKVISIYKDTRNLNRYHF